MAVCACTACAYTPGNLYTCMTCTPLISVDTMGINQDFRFEMKKICTHLRGGSDITEPRLRVHICLFVHYALNHLYFFHFSFLLPPLPSIIDLFLKKTRRWRNTTLPHSPAFAFEYELIWRGRSLRFCVPVVQRKSSRINRKQ